MRRIGEPDTAAALYHWQGMTTNTTWCVDDRADTERIEPNMVLVPGVPKRLDWAIRLN
jgi:hypothetical protein